MLPEIGTPERRQLEQEALTVALTALDLEYGSIPNALYRLYMTYRERFLVERGLNRPSGAAGVADALLDAAQLRSHVEDVWRQAIRAVAELDA